VIEYIISVHSTPSYSRQPWGWLSLPIYLYANDQVFFADACKKSYLFSIYRYWGIMTDLPRTDDIDWEDILPKLFAFTHKLLGSLTWFRGKKTDSFLKGKEVHDYVYEAIERFLQNPEKFKPEKGRSLENYLKFHIIRTLVGNDVVSEENKTSQSVIPNALEDDSEESLVDLYPSIEATFDQQIDYDNVMDYLSEQVKGDRTVENIFMGICHFGLKRGEIITEFEMGSNEYANGVRRLNTILRTAATIFQLKAKAK
jgi:hypothetical protein